MSISYRRLGNSSRYWGGKVGESDWGEGKGIWWGNVCGYLILGRGNIVDIGAEGQ